MRIVNLIVVVALVLAAAYVYKIKFDSTVRGRTRVARLRTEIRPRARQAVAALQGRVVQARQSFAHRGAWRSAI